MTSLERLLKTLGHQEPDRVPLFLLLTLHGAKELGLSIRDYFSKPENVVEGQLRLGQKYQNDCIYTFFYAPIETEALGGELTWSESGPPDSGEPLFRNIEKIKQLKVPDVRSNNVLQKVIKATEALHKEVGNKIPIIGAVTSPFSLPVRQIGLDNYLEVMQTRKDLFRHLIKVNQEYCVTFANMQLDAGATVICYFDTLVPKTRLPEETYLNAGFRIAQQTISKIKGPVATYFAPEIIPDIIDTIVKTGAVIAGTSSFEDIGLMKKACKGRLTVMGNLNSREMHTWDVTKTKQTVQDIIRKAASGGGFILSDDTGEIPFQISEETLMTISETTQTFGQYPIRYS